MTRPSKAAPTLLFSALGVCCGLVAPLASAQNAATPASAQGTATPASAAGPVARVRWLAELGAESLLAAPHPAVAGSLVVSVPGAVYVFDREGDGRLRKRARLPADSAAANGLALSGSDLALADRLGTVSVWSMPPTGDLRLRWRRELGERVTSVGWSGGPLVLAATWGGRLAALSAEDGSAKWSLDIGGRAEAPAIAEGGAVYVATKARTLLRVDAKTGLARWRVTLPGVALHPPALLKERAAAAGTSPAAEKARLVLVGTWDGQLVAYDVLTGRLAWSVVLGAKLTAGPLVVSGLVAVVTADGAVRAYDLTGHALWTAPGAADGPATLIWQESAGSAPRLLSASRVLVGLSPSTGERSVDYPRGALDELQRRFADAMLEGEKTYSGAEKQAIQEQEAFEISGPLFGPARLFSDSSGAVSQLAFGSEEGWAYAFDAATLRPLARYHAGPPAEGAPQPVDGRVIVTTGEDVYALDAQTGRVAWKRTVGGEPALGAADGTLAVRAGGRVHAISIADGALAWSLKGGVRALAPATAGEPPASGAPWLADDGAGNLRALVAPGRFVGDPLPIEGELLAVLATGPRSWLVATQGGKLLGVAWEELAAPTTAAPPTTDTAAAGVEAGQAAAGRLVTSWEKTWGEPLAELQIAAGRALVRSVSGALASVDLTTQQEVWRQTLAKGDRVVVRPQAVLILGADALRVHDAATGTLKHQQALTAPALAADVRGELPPALGLPFGGGRLRWLDRLGRAHQAALGSGRGATSDLGVTLAAATPVQDGFLVTTAAGEVGLVEFYREE
jgi:outer membrane protein assembly factor BamB